MISKSDKIPPDDLISLQYCGFTKSRSDENEISCMINVYIGPNMAKSASIPRTLS